MTNEYLTYSFVFNFYLIHVNYSFRPKFRWQFEFNFETTKKYYVRIIDSSKYLKIWKDYGQRKTCLNLKLGAT